MTSRSQSVPTQVLLAETNDVRPFARLLKGIGLKHNAVMTVSDAGFEVTVEEVKTLFAIAWIPTNLFQTFEYTPLPSGEPACFEISLDALLQCLNIFGNASTSATVGPVLPAATRNRRRWAGEGEGGEGDLDDAAEWRPRGKERRTGMRMSWMGPGSPLSMLLQDDARGPMTNCELTVLEPEDLVNQPFNSDDCVLYLIMKSEWFRDALLDLPPSSTRITLVATPRDQPVPPEQPNATGSSNARHKQRADVGNFSIQAEGDFGKTELDYPNDKDVMDRFDCQEQVSFSYHSAHIAMLSRALNASIKICLQIESSGYLCVQIMMPVSENLPTGNHSGILEFKMNPLDEEE
ncbi:Rad1/Rec1/Rad17 [Naematelia encephala]|uniref:Rad1/Rec1/Rad17 n=1 Tax=Naematelia encephala TaxID=71784 RepID=A0A1Y2B5C1_9TREE|nr:Rad1/Rec1/Rad17 [Naematelia encephala]